ncbi:MAG: serine hydrolase, partial [Oscillospiraceae bacterium]
MKFNFKKIIAIFCVGTIALNTCFFALASGGNNDDTQGKSVSVNVKSAVGDTLSLAKMSPPTLVLLCKNAVLMSADTGEVLYEQLPDEQVPIASITKIMTLLLTLEAVEKGKISLSDKVPVSEFAYGMGGSQIWLEPGELFTLDELIKAICISSANDAAVAVCEYVGGSEGVFLQMMNDRATELGMKNT